MANFTSNTQVHGCSLILGLSLVLTLVFSQPLASQTRLSSQNKKALKLYEKGQSKSKERDFESAIAFFNGALKQDPTFFEAYLRKGSLFNAMGMMDSVYANFTRYLALSPSSIPSILDKMAFMAFERGEYAQSKSYLTQLLVNVPEAGEQKRINLIQQSLDFAQKELENGVEIDIFPMPKEINRFALQYLPTITIDNSTLIYTKRDYLEGDEDIVASYFRNGHWTAAQSISPKINSPLNEGACTVSADGKVMILTSCDKRDSYGSCDLYITRKNRDGWTRPKNLGKPINTHYWESQPALSADGKVLYFASNRPGGQGGRDLWVSTYTVNKWSEPKNLGNQINTFKDETTPYIHPNGETLFFSSNGHVGMGGYDLIRAERVDSTWSNPRNLGHPINSYNDEVALLLAGDGKTAYFAKEVQKDFRIVDSKIVRFSLPKDQETTPATYVVGRVLDEKTENPIKARVEVVDLIKNELLFRTTSDSISGAYTMVLPSDKELVYYIKKKGYLYFEHNFFTESNSPASPDTLDIRLRRIEPNQSLILKNIYFELDSYELNRKSLTEIENAVQILKENPTITVEISGHTDNLGSDAYNLRLSENRAKEVFNEILEDGIDPNRLQFKGYGASLPTATNDTEKGRQSNRRIEFRVLRIMP